jgi:hypothetical protein
LPDPEIDDHITSATARLPGLELEIVQAVPGRVNYLPMTKTTDWRDYTLRMTDALHRVGPRHYLKELASED